MERLIWSHNQHLTTTSEYAANVVNHITIWIYIWCWKCFFVAQLSAKKVGCTFKIFKVRYKMGKHFKQKLLQYIINNRSYLKAEFEDHEAPAICMYVIFQKKAWLHILPRWRPSMTLMLSQELARSVSELERWVANKLLVDWINSWWVGGSM